MRNELRDSSGKEFEKAVAEIQSQMDPNSTVTHNEFLIDRKGQRRQFDVVIRGRFAGCDLLGVIECKDWKEKVGNEVVDSFVTKSNHINANLKIIVSKNGFTEPALVSCQHEGIAAYSLLPNDPHKFGYFMGNVWYAKIFAWKEYNLVVHFKLPIPSDLHFGLDDVKIENSPLIDWFKKQLDEKYGTFREEKPIEIQIVFEKPTELEVVKSKYVALGISFSATRVTEVRKKAIQVTGNAFYDWLKASMLIPPKGEIISGPIKADLSDWEITTETIPPSKGFGDFRLEYFLMHFSKDEEVVDLMKL